MRILGNIIWLIFGGLTTALEYFVCGFLLIITIIGIPFGIQSFKLGILTLWPFGKTTVQSKHSDGCLSSILNIIWIVTGGIVISVTHLLFGVLLCITIIGIPFGRQHFKLATLALTPFGREIVDKE